MTIEIVDGRLDGRPARLKPGKGRLRLAPDASPAPAEFGEFASCAGLLLGADRAGHQFTSLIHEAVKHSCRQTHTRTLYFPGNIAIAGAIRIDRLLWLDGRPPTSLP